jgi:hypothetical protein
VAAGGSCRLPPSPVLAFYGREARGLVYRAALGGPASEVALRQGMAIAATRPIGVGCGTAGAQAAMKCPA